MPLTRAIYDEVTQAYAEEPFRFSLVPFATGPKLDADIAIVLSCYARAGVLPTGPALLFMGELANGLFLRRNGTRENWAEFMAEVGRRHPSIVAHDACMRARVSGMATGDRSGAQELWKPSLPEVCTGSALLEMVPPGITIVADAALPGGRGPRGHVRRCDFHIISRRGEKRIEVAGLITRFGPPPTFHGAQYAQIRMPARFEAYATLGLPQPVTIYADEVLDRSRLLPIIAEIISELV